MGRKSKEIIIDETRLPKSLAALRAKESELIQWLCTYPSTHRDWDKKVRELNSLFPSMETERNRILNPSDFKKFKKHTYRINNIYFN